MPRKDIRQNTKAHVSPSKSQTILCKLYVNFRCFTSLLSNLDSKSYWKQYIYVALSFSIKNTKRNAKQVASTKCICLQLLHTFLPNTWIKYFNHIVNMQHGVGVIFSSLITLKCAVDILDWNSEIRECALNTQYWK